MKGARAKKREKKRNKTRKKLHSVNTERILYILFIDFIQFFSLDITLCSTTKFSALFRVMCIVTKFGK